MQRESLFLFGAPLITFTFLPSNVEAAVNICLIIVAITAALYAGKVATLFGGALGKTWTLLAWVAYFFAAYQIMLALELFGIFEFNGIDEMFEVLIAIFLLAAFYKAYKTLKGQMSGK